MPARGPGDVLRGRYRLVEPLGEGGMAVVWRGYDEVLGRQVALKLLKAELAGDARAARRMHREAQVAGLLAHPHIAAIHDYGESVRPPGDTLPFVVMPVLDGRALPDIPGLPPEVAALCHQCLEKDPRQRPTSDHLAVRLAEIPGVPVVALAQTDDDKDSAIAGQTAFLPLTDSPDEEAGVVPRRATAMLASRSPGAAWR